MPILLRVIFWWWTQNMSISWWNSSLGFHEEILHFNYLTFDISDFKQIDPKVLDYAATRLQVMIITMINNDQIIFIKIMTRWGWRLCSGGLSRLANKATNERRPLKRSWPSPLSHHHHFISINIITSTIFVINDDSSPLSSASSLAVIKMIIKNNQPGWNEAIFSSFC